jgi:hypothetical protein
MTGKQKAARDRERLFDWAPGTLAVCLDLYRSVIVHMITMDIMQAAIVNIVHMVPVTHGKVGILCPMHVAVMGAGIQGRFAGGICLGNLQNMFVYMPVMDKMHMTFMQIVPMIDMPELVVATRVPVDVGVFAVDLCCMRRIHGGTGPQRREQAPRNN